MLDVQSGPSEDHVQATPTPTGIDWRLVAGAGVIVAGSLYVVWLLWGSFYYVDDFQRLSEASHSSLDWSYLSESVFGHFVPGWRLTYFLLQRSDPLGYTPVIVITALLQGFTLLGFMRLLNALFGRLWRNLLFVGWLAVTPAMLSTQFWFANALHVLPSMALTIWSLDGFVRYLGSRRLAYLVYSVLSLALGLMFYEKPVIVLVVMPLLILAIATQSGPVGVGIRSGVHRITSLWRVWVLYVVFPIAYFSYFFTHQYYVPGSRPALGELAHATWLAWFQGIGPALIGGPFRWQVAGVGGLSIAAPSEATTYVALGLVVAVVIGSFVVAERAWRGWTLLVVGFVLSFTVAAWGRLESIGLSMARDFRYSADTMPLVLLGVALAYTAVRGELGEAVAQVPAHAPAPPPLRHRKHHPGRSGVAVALALVVVVAYLGTSSISMWRYRTVWDAAVSRTYWNNVDMGITQLERSGRPFSLYNVVVPETVRFLAQYPGDLLSATAGIKYPHLRYNDPSRTLYAPDPTTGVIRPARDSIYESAGTGAADRFIVPDTGALKNGELCLAPGLSHVTLPMQRTLPLAVYTMTVDYRSVAQSAFTPYAVPVDRTKPIALTDGTQLPARLRTAIVTLAPTTMRSASLLVSSNAGICLQTVTIGIPGS